MTILEQISAKELEAIERAKSGKIYAHTLREMKELTDKFLYRPEPTITLRPPEFIGVRECVDRDCLHNFNFNEYFIAQKEHCDSERMQNRILNYVYSYNKKYNKNIAVSTTRISEYKVKVTRVG